MGKDSDKKYKMKLADILNHVATMPLSTASPDFKGMEEGERLLAALEAGITPDRKRPNLTPQPNEHSLYDFIESSEGNRYAVPIIQKVFDLLAEENGFGKFTFVGKYDQDSTEFRQKLKTRNPSWIGELGMQKFSKLIYMYGSTGGGTDTHGVAERICDGSIHAMLKRGMELGPYKKPEPTQQMAASGPQTPQQS